MSMRVISSRGGDHRHLVLNTLSAHGLQQIAFGEKLAIIIPLATRAQCSRFMSALLQDENLSLYGSSASSTEESKSAATIRRGGLTCYEACSSPDLREKYFSLAERLDRHLDALFLPLSNPIKTLQERLRSIWQTGVRPELWRGRAMAAQVSRIFDVGTEALPHNDVLWVDQNGESLEQPLTSQLAVNTYVAILSRTERKRGAGFNSDAQTLSDPVQGFTTKHLAISPHPHPYRIQVFRLQAIRGAGQRRQVQISRSVCFSSEEK
jgi:hypothetical protein